jgi:hypothetical protein
MTPRAVRKAERAAHLLWGSLIALYVYGLLPSWGEPMLRWVVVPAAVASGLAMWFAAPIRRLWRSLAAPRWSTERRPAERTST